MTIGPDEESCGDAPRHAKRLGREVAMQYLFGCELRGEVPGAASFEEIFPVLVESLGITEARMVRKCREYAIKLYTAVALHEDEIDKVISERCEHWSMERLSAVDRNIMRVAIAEMLYFDSVPRVVSIDEAVEIARDYSGENAGNFINGVLNAIKNGLTEKR